MSTFQQHQSNGFSPILLSPSSTTNPTITGVLFPCYDNSDQGSVDSDYTSLSSSKFYGHSGSTSSLHRQGRSQSIDELASTNANTTTIPTRHFNGVSNVNKTNGDPLQFVKIHPNHDLIERAQEQLTLAESRKRLQETFKLITPLSTPSKAFSGIDDDETDWSKVKFNSSVNTIRIAELHLPLFFHWFIQQERLVHGRIRDALLSHLHWWKETFEFDRVT